MTESFLVLKTCGQGEVIEKKSRFIAYIESVKTQEEAFSFVEKVKKQNYDAKHNCYAFSVGLDNSEIRFSDDGEPQGTAGKPILDVITNSKLCNVCIVVTRYFGGTLLGTGGLIRAYTKASKLALQNSTTHIIQRLNVINIITSYTDLAKIQFVLNKNELEIVDITYEDEVKITTNIPIDLTEIIKKDVTEVTSGRIKFKKIKEIVG